MVVVVEDDEEARVFARELGLLVVRRPDRFRQLAVDRIARDLDELEGLDLHGLAVLDDFEVGQGQVLDGIALAVGDEHVDADEVDTRPEGGLRRGRGRLVGPRLPGGGGLPRGGRLRARLGPAAAGCPAEGGGVGLGAAG